MNKPVLFKQVQNTLKDTIVIVTTIEERRAEGERKGSLMERMYVFIVRYTLQRNYMCLRVQSRSV